MLQRQHVLRLGNPSQADAVTPSIPSPVHTNLVQLLARLIARSAMAAEPQKGKHHDASNE